MIFLESVYAKNHRNDASIVSVKMRPIGGYRLSTSYENQSWLTWTGSYRNLYVLEFIFKVDIFFVYKTRMSKNTFQCMISYCCLFN
jgi:hypothetical protein